MSAGCPFCCHSDRHPEVCIAVFILRSVTMCVCTLFGDSLYLACAHNSSRLGGYGRITAQRDAVSLSLTYDDVWGEYWTLFLEVFLWEYGEHPQQAQELVWPDMKLNKVMQQTLAERIHSFYFGDLEISNRNLSNCKCTKSSLCSRAVTRRFRSFSSQSQKTS